MYEYVYATTRGLLMVSSLKHITSGLFRETLRAFSQLTLEFFNSKSMYEYPFEQRVAGRPHRGPHGDSSVYLNVIGLL